MQEKPAESLCGTRADGADLDGSGVDGDGVTDDLIPSKGRLKIKRPGLHRTLSTMCSIGSDLIVAGWIWQGGHKNIFFYCVSILWLSTVVVGFEEAEDGTGTAGAEAVWGVADYHTPLALTTHTYTKYRDIYIYICPFSSDCKRGLIGGQVEGDVP